MKTIAALGALAVILGLTLPAMAQSPATTEHGWTWTGATPRRPRHAGRAWGVAAPSWTTPHASWTLHHLHGPA